MMKFPIRIPFVESLGLELLRFENGEADIAIDLREELCNSWSVMHGGVTMTLLDVAMAHAARSPGQPGVDDARGVVTIEMKTSFMRPGLGRLVAHGRPLQRTTSFAFCEAWLLDVGGQRIAHATGTFKFLKGLPADGRKIHRLNASD